MRFAPFFVLAVVCSSCTVAQGPASAIAYDCRLFAGPFAVATTAGPAAEAFGHAPDGVLLVEQEFNSDLLTGTRFLDLATHMLTVSNSRGVYRQPLDTARATQVDRLCRDMERGAFRQICVVGPTEGSRTLLLVRAKGDTVLRYEAPQYDYRHLNPDEQGKLPRALALIGLLGQPAN